MNGKSTLNEGLPYSKSAPGFALTRFFSSESLGKTGWGQILRNIWKYCAPWSLLVSEPQKKPASRWTPESDSCEEYYRQYWHIWKVKVISDMISDHMKRESDICKKPASWWTPESDSCEEYYRHDWHIPCYATKKQINFTVKRYQNKSVLFGCHPKRLYMWTNVDLCEPMWLN